jgi:cobalt-zinc-cadmium efflux system protein
VIRTALIVTLAIALLELGGGLFAGSLALISDSAHVFMDAFALGIVIFAAAGSARPATARRTFGFARLEILAALGNAALLFAITVLIVISAIHRFAVPELPKSGPMLAIAVVAFVLNLGIGMALFHSARRNVNVRAAFFHVVSDALGAFAVIVGSIVILLTGQAWVDPAISLLIAAIIVAGVFRIVREAADVLLESAPEHASIGAIRERIRDLSGVVDVHDLHVWTLGPESHALSAHVLLNDARISEASELLRQIDARMRSEFGIGHVTLQFECENCAEDDRIVCTQAAAREG